MNPSTWFHLSPPPLSSITSSICQATSKLGTLAGTFLPPIENDDEQEQSPRTPGKDFTSMFNELSSTMVKGAQQFLGNLSKECRSHEHSDLPWMRDGEENEEMKRLILALSKDEENFLRSPPTGANYVFDMSTISSMASAILEVDPALQQMRFHLVPKQIKEEAFWRNYFYRLYQIEQHLKTREQKKEKIIEKENVDDDTAVIDMDEVQKDEKDFDENEWDQGVVDDMENLSPEDFQN